MRYYFFQILMMGVIALFVNPNKVWADTSPKKPTLARDFAQAKAFLNSFHNDSAKIILNGLADQLSAKDQLNSPFGLKVQLRLAEALEKDNEDEKAIEKLLYVMEESEKQEEWSVLANSYILLARLQEKLKRWDNCREKLREARAAIILHNLDSLYPRYATRISSYYRFNGSVDSALFYAREAVRTASILNQHQERVVGHLLLGMLLSRSDYEEAVSHYITAGEYWQEVGDYTGYSAILGNLSKLHQRNGKLRLALIYNDSALVAATKASNMGNEERWMFYTGYKQRASIYKEMGQSDSAWYYLSLGYKNQLGDVYKSNHEKVIEIDARYNDEKKALKIEEQALQIKYEKERRNSLWGIILIVLLFTCILTYSYLQLRKASRKTKEQALAIAKANRALSASLRQQIVLQGEVHHRVKNNLQVIIGLLEMQKEELEDPNVIESLDAMSNRIYSMAAVHEMLYQKEGAKHVSLTSYTERLCKHFSNFSKQEPKPIFKLDMGNRDFSLETLMSLGIILSELITNSLKYATDIGKQLRIRIKMEPKDQGYLIQFRDNGPGFPNGALAERAGGLGTYLLKSMSRQLGGHLECVNDQGAVTNIFFKEKN